VYLHTDRTRSKDALCNNRVQPGVRTYMYIQSGL